MTPHCGSNMKPHLVFKRFKRQGSHYNLQTLSLSLSRSIYIYIKLSRGTCLFQDASTACYFCSRVKSYKHKPTKKTTKKHMQQQGRQQNLPALGPSSCHILRRPSGVLWQNFDALFRSRPGQWPHFHSFPPQISTSTTSLAKRGIW